MSFKLMLATLSQGELGEPGQKGRDGSKVRMHLSLIMHLNLCLTDWQKYVHSNSQVGYD